LGFESGRGKRVRVKKHRDQPTRRTQLN
jgi:hypothetical protein